MHRILERFSALASTGVIFVYLGALFLGSATYFVGHLVGMSPDIAATVGVALAAAVEVHSFLSQRLTRQLWQQRNRLDEAAPEWDSATTQLRTHLAITCGLVAFSVFNSIAFWSIVLHPVTVSDWLQVSVRGLVIPLAFLAAGFLTPLQHDASQLLQDAAYTMLRRAVRITVRQWRKRIARAHRAGIDLAPVAIELMDDAGERDAARRMRIIARALDRAEQQGVLPSDGTPLHPPTGPGSPTARPRAAREQVLRLTPYAHRTHSAEERARTAWRPGMSINQLAEAAQVSRTTAAKYRRLLVADVPQRRAL